MNRRLFMVVLGGLILILAIFIVLKIKNLSLRSRQTKEAKGSLAELLVRTGDLEKEGSLLEAESIYQKLVNDFSNSEKVADWQKKIEEINIKLLFSPTITPKSTLYEIKPADTLSKIARDFKTTIDLIKKSNNLTNDRILPGRKLKIWTAPFNILIDKSQNILFLKSDEEIIKSYIVSTGINNSTPTGNFKITSKLINPTWYKAGAIISPGSPENILGSRWLGLDLAGYGIHGTIEPQSLGKQATQGCVRMANPDIEELYIIVPVGTELTIVD